MESQILFNAVPLELFPKRHGLYTSYAYMLYSSVHNT